jgi:PAS domain S-box-containing protein
MRDEEMSKEELIKELVILRRALSGHVSMAEKLSSMDERLRLVSKATSDVVWDWDLTTKRLFWGSNFEIHFGYALSEIEPGIESWHSRLHPNDRARVIAEVDGALARGDQRWSSEYSFKRKDGSYVDVFDRGYAIYGQDGKATRMIGAMIDITERKRIERALREGEMRFRTLSEGSPMGIFQTDTEGRSCYVNSRFTEISGMTLEQAQGNWLQHIHPEDRERVNAAWQQSVNSGGAFSLEYRYLHSDHKAVWVLGVAFIMRNEKNEIVGFIGNVIDITERKKFDEDLRKNMEELRLLLAITVDRENNMIQLKKEVNALALELKRPAPYDVSFLNQEKN